MSAVAKTARVRLTATLALAIGGAGFGALPSSAAMPKIFTGLPPGTVVAYSSYLGSDGFSESVDGVATDPEGNVYVAGSTDGAASFPTTPGAYQTTASGPTDAFVAKFDPAGQLVWSTLFGGSGGDSAISIDVTAEGEPVVSGTTLSEDLVTTPGAFQSEFKGVLENCEFQCSGDAFVARFSADGSELVYSTYVGGALNEVATTVQLDDVGNAYLTGFTTSPDFPATQNAYDTDYADPSCFDQCDADTFVAQLNPTGTQLRFATFFGGTSWDSPAGLDVDAEGNIYIAGATRSVDLDTSESAYQPEKNGNVDFDFSPFVAAFDPDGSALRYATYLGGAPEEQATAISVESDGVAWVGGWASGKAFVTTDDALQPGPAGQGDGFAAALSRDGSELEYSTRFGGSRFDSVRGIEAGSGAAITLFGSTASDDIQTRRAAQPASGGVEDLFYARFQPGQEEPVFSTYLGGDGFEFATGMVVHELDTAYLVGATDSEDLPLAGRFFSDDLEGQDGLLIRVDPGTTASLRVDRGGFNVRRVRTNVVESNLRWRNVTGRTHRLVVAITQMFDVRVRPDSAYHFTFPAGRFQVDDRRTHTTQRVAVQPGSAWGDVAGTIELAWARFPLGDDFVYDVQIKRGETPYETLFDGTSLTEATLTEPIGSYRFRARVRNVDTGEMSNWSPPSLLAPPG